jgi:hypothetical protein
MKTKILRDFIGDNINIDGRMIQYRLVTVHDYLLAKGYTQEQIDEFQTKQWDLYRAINQIMAIKQSCFLLRRTSHSCQSLTDNLYSLKVRLIREIKEKYNFDFDDDFVERDGQPEKGKIWEPGNKNST